MSGNQRLRRPVGGFDVKYFTLALALSIFVVYSKHGF
jgi:hypothetical protein